jgi:hypothetical protein
MVNRFFGLCSRHTQLDNGKHVVGWQLVFLRLYKSSTSHTHPHSRLKAENFRATRGEKSPKTKNLKKRPSEADKSLLATPAPKKAQRLSSGPHIASAGAFGSRGGGAM